MIHAKDNPQPTETPNTVVEFQKKIANGGVIPIARKTPEGDAMELVVRWAKSPIDSSKTVASVGLFTKRGDKIVPIGFNDWLIVGEEAWAAGIMSGDIGVKDEIDASFARTRADNSASTLWVEDGYQRQGYGSFLVSASVVLLDEMGVRSAQLMGLTKAGKNTAMRFGASTYDSVLVADLKKHPTTISAIERFINPNT